MLTVRDRFIKYAKIHTTSLRDSTDIPSSPIQFDLARELEKDLQEIGLEEISLDDHCYLMATLPATTDRALPVIGFIAHMDTSPDMSGENVNPQIIEKFEGGEIVLNEALNVRMKPEEFPELGKYIGQELITTDGTTPAWRR